MPIFETGDRRILFIHIPRTGGTSIEAWFSGQASKGFFATIAPGALKVCPQHLVVDDIRLLMGELKWDSAFSIVRNPYERMESAYFFRMNLWKHPTGTLPDFSAWVLRQLKQFSSNPFVLDNHIRPQTDFLDSDIKVFKFEMGMREIQQKVSRLTGIRPGSDIEHVNQSERQPVKWTLNALNAFNGLYKVDFDQLGYEMRQASLDIDAD